MEKSLLKNKGKLITLIGIAVMAILIVIKLFLPGSLYSGYALIIGIVSFFTVETVEKIPDDESGIRFHTILKDLKKPQVLFWVLLPIGTTIMGIIVGKLFFESFYKEYIDHVIGRTTLEMDFSNSLTWSLTMIVTVVGEEIAFRGFLYGKGSRIMPDIVCLLGSSLLFTLAHIASGDLSIVFIDLLGIFVDAVFYAVLYRKSQNCLITFIPHCMNNLLGLLLVRVLF